MTDRDEPPREPFEDQPEMGTIDAPDTGDVEQECTECGAHFSEPHAPDCSHADHDDAEPSRADMDARYLDPVALVAWLAKTADDMGTLDTLTIDRLREQATYEAMHHPARMVEARVLRTIRPTGTDTPSGGAGTL